MDTDPLDPAGLRELASIAATGAARNTENDAAPLAIVAAIYNVGATLGQQLKRVADELAHIR